MYFQGLLWLVGNHTMVFGASWTVVLLLSGKDHQSAVVNMEPFLSSHDWGLTNAVQLELAIEMLIIQVQMTRLPLV